MLSDKEIVSTLVREYDWEVATDTRTTWRIGDGTAAFYNYIYYAVAGFTENDTFRSNQIREGMISRHQALATIYDENQPRFESIQWYCDTIGIDMESALERINSIRSPQILIRETYQANPLQPSSCVGCTPGRYCVAAREASSA